MRIITCEQGSPEWWEVKCGIPSASNFDRILTPKTMKPSGQADDYIAELCADLVSQGPPYFTEQEHPVNTYAMRNGIHMEPRARAWYQMQSDLEVKQVGFVLTDDCRFGCSPDGLIFADGRPVRGLELKVPLTKTHAKYLIAGIMPAEYLCQVHGGLAVAGLREWDWASYNETLAPLCLRVTPDAFTKALKIALELFDDCYRAVRAPLGI